MGDIRGEAEEGLQEADLQTEVISFSVPSLVKEQIERRIDFVIDGAPSIKRHPSVSMMLGKFDSKLNIEDDKEITEDEAFHAFVAIGFFRYLAAMKNRNKKMYKCVLALDEDSLALLDEVITILKGKDAIDRRGFPKVMAEVLHDYAMAQKK